VKVQGKLNMHIILETVLMLLTKNYQNWAMLVEATACQSWHVFWDTVYFVARWHEKL